MRPLLLAAGTLALSLSSPLTSWAKDQPLAGTSWQLLEIQSLDDAQGTTPIPDPSRFTLHLEADGTARLRLDCNRATGKWTAEPSADSSNGSLRFGPLVTTRALCSPPQLDQMVLSQLSFVRGYRLKDGRLNLSLLADGGILVWDSRDSALEKAIRLASPHYSADLEAAGGSQRPSRYASTQVDLNDDGSDETLVYLMGPHFCGTGGCNLLVFSADSDSSTGGYTLLNDLPISRPPVIVSSRRTSGWRDLWRKESGGGMPATYVRHSFIDGKYVEQERRPAEQMPEGRMVFSESLTFDDGLVLEPAP